MSDPKKIIVKQVHPNSDWGADFRVLEVMDTVDGPRTRVADGAWPSFEKAVVAAGILITGAATNQAARRIISGDEEARESLATQVEPDGATCEYRTTEAVDGGPHVVRTSDSKGADTAAPPPPYMWQELLRGEGWVEWKFKHFPPGGGFLWRTIWGPKANVDALSSTMEQISVERDNLSRSYIDMRNQRDARAVRINELERELRNSAVRLGEVATERNDWQERANDAAAVVKENATLRVELSSWKAEAQRMERKFLDLNPLLDTFISRFSKR